MQEVLELRGENGRNVDGTRPSYKRGQGCLSHVSSAAGPRGAREGWPGGLSVDAGKARGGVVSHSPDLFLEYQTLKAFGDIPDAVINAKKRKNQFVKTDGFRMFQQKWVSP